MAHVYHWFWIKFTVCALLSEFTVLLELNEANHNRNLSSPDKDNVDPYSTPLLSSGSAGSINDNEDDNDDGDLAGPAVGAHVNLAKIPHKFYSLILL